MAMCKDHGGRFWCSTTPGHRGRGPSVVVAVARYMVESKGGGRRGLDHAACFLPPDAGMDVARLCLIT